MRRNSHPGLDICIANMVAGPEMGSCIKLVLESETYPDVANDDAQ